MFQRILFKSFPMIPVCVGAAHFIRPSPCGAAILNHRRVSASASGSSASRNHEDFLKDLQKRSTAQTSLMYSTILISLSKWEPFKDTPNKDLLPFVSTQVLQNLDYIRVMYDTRSLSVGRKANLYQQILRDIKDAKTTEERTLYVAVVQYYGLMDN